MDELKQARLYFEAHVTIDPVFDNQRAVANTIAERNGFKLAKLLMEKDGVRSPSTLDTFMTAHGKDYDDIFVRTGNMVIELLDAGFVVRRYKIEDTLLDSRHDSAFGIKLKV